MHRNLHRHVGGSAGKTGWFGGLSKQPSKWVLWFKFSVCSPFLSLFPVEFLVEQENEQVDVDGGPVEELHHRHAFVLQLEEILIF